MPSRAWKLRIQDILESVSAVENYVNGMTFEEFARDQKTIDAVVRRFAVIGEAANHVPEDVSHCNPQIPWEQQHVFCPTPRLPRINLPPEPGPVPLR